MVQLVRDQARACRSLGSPLYAELLDRVADDVESGGPAREVLRGHEEDPGPSALALRLMGAAHRMALDGRAPRLAATYPSCGGSGDPEAAWEALHRLLAIAIDELRRWLGQPPQTNEVGRATALVGALHHVVARHGLPVRLFEIGASAGLNLRADRFRLEWGAGHGVGPRDSPVVLRDAWAGDHLPPADVQVQVVERLGCDTAPVDPTTAEGRLSLMSYVWPDQTTRIDRLRGALALAADHPATVVRAAAGDFLDRLDLVPGTTTVVWHSVMRQYLDVDERDHVDAVLDALGSRATAGTRLARASMEPRRRQPGAPHEFLVTLREWPDGPERVLGASVPHGIPTTWD